MLTYLRTMLRALIKDERGATMVEYGLIIGLIAVILITVLTNLGTGLNSLFGSAKDAVDTASGGGGGGT